MNFPDWQATSGQGAHSFFADPVFVTGAGFNPLNYKLKSSSPGLNHGKSLDYVDHDFARLRRPQAGQFDLGL